MGRGFPPKDPKKRARRNIDPHPKIEVPLAAAEQPELPPPPSYVGTEWPARTLEWWKTWQDSGQSAAFTSTDWDFLIDTALLHALVWSAKGDTKHLTELRLRLVKFGATAEDRLRLRMTPAGGEIIPVGSKPKPPSDESDSRDYYGDLRVLPGAV